MLQDERPVLDTPESDVSWARERAEMLQGLYIHLLVFMVINGGLFVINWATKGADGGWWARWPLMFWGLGLVIHVVSTAFPVFSSQWVDRKERELLRRG